MTDRLNRDQARRLYVLGGGLDALQALEAEQRRARDTHPAGQGATWKAKREDSSESLWQARVRGLARKAGALFYHTHDARRSDEGFPDCIIIVDGRLIAAELKTRGLPTGAQLEWLAGFRAAGADTYVWYPADEPEVLAVLGLGPDDAA